MKNTTNFFEEKPNVKSFTRLSAGVIVASALCWGFIDVVASIFVKDYDVHESLILGAIGLALGAKVFQKPDENEKTEESES